MLKYEHTVAGQNSNSKVDECTYLTWLYLADRSISEVGERSSRINRVVPMGVTNLSKVSLDGRFSSPKTGLTKIFFRLYEGFKFRYELDAEIGFTSRNLLPTLLPASLA